MNLSKNDIILPSLPNNFNLKTSLDALNTLIEDLILYLAYGIALLCSFKFVVYIINGFTSNPHMGSKSMDDSAFFG